MVVKARFPLPEQAAPAAPIPVLTDAELSVLIVQSIAIYLPDADSHRARAAETVEGVLKQWRQFGTRA